MARKLTRDERVRYMMEENKALAPHDFKSSEAYCTAYIDGMIACEEAYKSAKIEVYPSPHPVDRDHLKRDFKTIIDDLETNIRHLKYMYGEL